MDMDKVQEQLMQTFHTLNAVQGERHQIETVATLTAAWIAHCPQLKPAEAVAMGFETYNEIKRKVIQR